MPVITVSRQLGSLGTEIAQLLCKNFKCQCLDKKSLEEAFGEYGIPKESIERFDEKKPGFWDLFKTDKARYLHFMKGAILDFASTGNGVILGRGGQILLQGVAGVLHLRVIAHLDVRKERIMKRFECDDTQAEHLLMHSDRERMGFNKFFYGEDWENPNLYHIVLNTGTLSAETAVQLIQTAANSREFKETQEEASWKLGDLCLEHEIKTAIIYYEKILVQFLEVHVERGMVTLRGIVDNPDDLNRCGNLTSQIPNVKEVNNQLYYSPITAAYGIHY